MRRFSYTLMLFGAVALMVFVGGAREVSAAPSPSLQRAHQVAQARRYDSHRGYRQSRLPLYRRDRLRRTRTQAMHRRRALRRVKVRRRGARGLDPRLRRRLLRQRGVVTAANVGHGGDIVRVSPMNGETLRHLSRTRYHRAHRAHRSGPWTLRRTSRSRSDVLSPRNRRDRRNWRATEERRALGRPSHRMSSPPRRSAAKWKVWER